MTKKKFQFCVLIYPLLTCYNVFAQQPYSQLSASVGVFRNGINDAAIGPYQLKGTSTIFSFQYARVKETNHHDIMIWTSTPTLSSSKSVGFKINSSSYFLGYGLTFRVAQRSKLSYWAGPALSMMANIRYPEFNTQAEALASIDALGKLRYQRSEKVAVEMSIGIPLTGLYFDRGYVMGEEELNFVEPSSVRGFRLNVAYTKQINPRWDYSIISRLNYSNFSLLNTVRNYSHQFLFSLNYRFIKQKHEKI